MRASIRSSVICLAGALAALWLCGAGAAWAGDGADLGSLQALLSDPTTGLCKLFHMSSCPQLPTVTQGVLEVAALGNNLPEMVRAQNSIPAGSSVTAGNPAAVPPPYPGLLTPLPLDSKTSPTLSALLSTLTPLAFISQRSGTAQATQLYDPTADAFLYSVGVSSFGYVAATGLTDPDTVYFFYDDTNRTNQNLAKGQIVAKFLLPLTVLNSNGTETAVPTTLQFRANNAGDCSTSTVVGNFSRASSGTQTLMAAQIGIDCAVVFSASPTSRQKHAIFEVAVPVLVTGACSPTPPATSCMPYTDPAYFYSLHNPGPPAKTNPVNTGVYTAFLFDDANGILGQGASIGLAPSAGPLGSPPPTGVTSSFALCANLPGGSGNGQAPIPSVGAYYAVATSGEIFLSAPLPSASTSACPPM